MDTPNNRSDWWRKRADEIEAVAARSGSPEAMRCFTDMRALLQAATAAPAPAQQEPATPIDAHRAAYFMRRFLHEEKMLGPNEQAALHFTIAALEAMESAAQHQDPQQQRPTIPPGWTIRTGPRPGTIVVAGPLDSATGIVTLVHNSRWLENRLLYTLAADLLGVPR